MTVRVLGPLEVTGWAEPPTRGKTTELLVYLATHPGRPVPAERLRTSVWPYDPERADVALATVHQEISRLRRCLGTERFPEAKGGYQLAESVVCDWARFEALVEASRALPELPGTDVLAEALALVRGEPFQDVGAKSYSWAFEEVLVARIEAAVADAAHLMAQRCLARRSSHRRATGPCAKGSLLTRGTRCCTPTHWRWPPRARAGPALTVPGVRYSG